MKRAVCCMLLLAACGGSSAADDLTGAREAADSVQATNDEAQAVEITIEGAPGSGPIAPRSDSLPSASQAAANAAAHVQAILTPPGCAAATLSGATVTYDYNLCATPRGLQLTGSMTAAYSVDTALHVHETAAGLSVGLKIEDLDVTATHTVSNGLKTVEVTTASAGTDELGNTFTREGTYTATWDSTCHTLDGSWNHVSGGETRATTISNYTRCSGSCPRSGTVTHQHLKRTITFTYDGTATVRWSSSSGKSGLINLPCTPAA